jgi:hypothetical protein
MNLIVISAQKKIGALLFQCRTYNIWRILVKRNSIYLRSKFSERELILLKKDLIDNSVYFILKIKNLGLIKEQIEEMATIAVERVLSTYNFGKDGSLGDLVKSEVMADLRAYYEKSYPGQEDEVIWPDLDKRKPYDKLLEALEKVKLLPRHMQEEIFWQVKEQINLRQQNILTAIYKNTSLTYVDISKKFGKRGVMTYRQIKIIYNQLVQVLKNLGVGI